MIHGIGYPKFYIYDSTGVTLQTIPANLGSSGCISLTKNVVLNEFEPDRLDIVNESPITRRQIREFLGFRYKCSIRVAKGDYMNGIVNYNSDQNSSQKINDVFKCLAIENYANNGHMIKFTPHNDIEDLDTEFPIWVDCKIVSLNKLGRIYSDSLVMEIKGIDLMRTPHPLLMDDLYVEHYF